MADFRYILNGEEIEAYQITEESRYQQKLWPEWLDSRQLITVDGQPWLAVGGEEKSIPAYGWLVRRSSGMIDVIGWQAMEGAEKVVPDIVSEDLDLDTEVGIDIVPIPVPVETELLAEVRIALEMSLMGNHEEASNHLRKLVGERVAWCSCAPGQCVKQGDIWGCRDKSPLVTSND